MLTVRQPRRRDSHHAAGGLKRPVAQVFQLVAAQFALSGQRLRDVPENLLIGDGLAFKRACPDEAEDRVQRRRRKRRDARRAPADAAAQRCRAARQHTAQQQRAHNCMGQVAPRDAHHFRDFRLERFDLHVGQHKKRRDAKAEADQERGQRHDR